MNYRDVDRLELILKLIGHLRRRRSPISRDRFLDDEDEIGLTAFRLSVIGEATFKLDDAIKGRHADIPWPSIYGMRNIIVHDYEGIVAQRLWRVFEEELDRLEQACRLELEG